MKRLSIAVAMAAAFPLAASAATLSSLSAGQILVSPQRYDGQHVEVTGSVEYLQQHVTRRGTAYATFWLCSKGCVNVFVAGTVNVTEGETITVQGTFSIASHGGEFSASNVIEADAGSF